MKAKRTAHTVYQPAYHFVWVPKYRRKILTGDVAERLKEIIREICAEYDWEIESLEVMVDHVHLFVSCPPRYAPAQAYGGPFLNLSGGGVVFTWNVFTAFDTRAKEPTTAVWGGEFGGSISFPSASGSLSPTYSIPIKPLHVKLNEGWQLTVCRFVACGR